MTILPVRESFSMVRFRTTPLLLCAIGFFGIFLGCGLFFLSRHVTLPDQSTPRVGPLLIPSARPSHYVGSHACTACHAEIAAAYQSHSMAHSMSEIGDEIAIEDYSSETIIPDRERFYQIERNENFVTHHERMSDIDETILYDQSMPVRFVLGSGTRGRSYVIDHDGLLFQSPIGWYANGKRWDLSPGYRTNRTQRFERSIGDGCLYCHAGRVEHSDLIPKRYSSKVFMEAAIGCERCHGPGENHVHQMEILGEGETCLDSLIINPSDLEPSRREAVCNQCHLAGEGVIPKFGRGLFDFRPGDLLDDTVVVFVKDEKLDTTPVNGPSAKSNRCERVAAIRQAVTRWAASVATIRIRGLSQTRSIYFIAIVATPVIQKTPVRSRTRNAMSLLQKAPAFTVICHGNRRPIFPIRQRPITEFHDCHRLSPIPCPRLRLHRWIMFLLTARRSSFTTRTRSCTRYFSFNSFLYAG